MVRLVASFRFRSVSVVSAVLAAVLVLPGTAAAASGGLDTTFSRDGQQFVNFGGADDFGYAVAFQSARIVEAGITGAGVHEDLALTRLTARGRVDTTFGRNGRVRTDVAGNSDEMSGGLAILQSGKILVA